HDNEPKHILRMLGDHALEADARVSVEEVEQALHEKLRGKDADYDSLGGLIFATLGRVPVKGEVIKLQGKFKIEILTADPRKIRQVRISRIQPHQVHP